MNKEKVKSKQCFQLIELFGKTFPLTYDTGLTIPLPRLLGSVTVSLVFL